MPTWKEKLADKIDAQIAEEIDVFETQLVLAQLRVVILVGIGRLQLCDPLGKLDRLVEAVGAVGVDHDFNVRPNRVAHRLHPGDVLGDRDCADAKRQCV